MSTPAEVVAALAQRLEAARADPEIQLAQAGLEERIAFRVASASVALVPGAAGWSVVQPAPAGCSVVLEAAPDAWRSAMSRDPPPGHQSITALRRAGHLTVGGDTLSFARALHLLERFLEIARADAVAPPGADGDEQVATGSAPAVQRDLGLLEGRYHRIATAKASATVYAERSGHGFPMVLLHTAGADSRQYQALLSDVALARDWQMHAFDLPMHGRSMPADAWDGGRWVLTQESYLAWCTAFLEQVVGSPAVVVGCSMGAAMALVLAADRPRLVRAAIALEAPLRASGRRSPYLTHAGVNASAHNPSYVRGLMSPSVPQAARRVATWIYGQGALGVYEGDLAFYEEFDGERVAPRIDAGRCPVAFLTGAYDYSASPADARRLSALVPGSTVAIMQGLGHFPMVEHPDGLRRYLAPVLERIRATLPDRDRP